jgi:hypothetical protein
MSRRNGSPLYRLLIDSLNHLRAAGGIFTSNGTQFSSLNVSFEKKTLRLGTKGGGYKI